MRIAVITNSLLDTQMGLWSAISDMPDVELLLIGRGVGGNGDLGQDAARIPNFCETRQLRPYGILSRGFIWWRYAGLRSALRTFAPDLIHLQSEPWGLLVAQTLAAAGGVPVVLHSADNMYTHGHLAETLVRLVAARRNLPKLAGLASWNTDGIRLALDNGLRSQVPRLVVPFVVPAINALVSLPDARNGGVTFLGRLVAEKGLDVALEACGIRQRTNLTTRITVIGDGPERKRLEALSESLALESRFLGELPWNDAQQCLAAASVVVVPSLTTREWKEQFGRVVLECFRVGVPVIASDSGALPEVVGGAGVVVPEGNATALAAALGRVLDDSQRMNALEEASRRAWDQRWSPAVLRHEVLGFWQRALIG